LLFASRRSDRRRPSTRIGRPFHGRDDGRLDHRALGVTEHAEPIQYAFSYPERWAGPLPSLDLAKAGRLDFDEPDTAAFPCLASGIGRLDAERSLPVVLNAANEIAWRCFWTASLGSRPIAGVIEQDDGGASAGRGGHAGQRPPVDVWHANRPARLPAG